MVLFQDISKPCDDLFRGFPHDRLWSINAKNRLTNPNFTHCASLSPSGSIQHTVGTKFVAPGDVTVSSSLTADGLASLSASYPAPFSPNCTFAGRLAKSLWREEAGIEAEVAGDVVGYGDHSRTVIQPLNYRWSHSHCLTPDVRALLGRYTHADFKLGFEVSGRALDRDALKCILGASVSNAIGDTRWTAAIKTGPLQAGMQLQSVTCSLHSQTIKPFPAEIGAEVSQLIQDRTSRVTLGALWRPNPADKDTYIKAKIDHEGKISGAIGHKLNDQLGVVVGCLFDGTKIVSSKEPNLKCGVQFNLMA